MASITYRALISCYSCRAYFYVRNGIETDEFQNNPRFTTQSKNQQLAKHEYQTLKLIELTFLFCFLKTFLEIRVKKRSSSVHFRLCASFRPSAKRRLGVNLAPSVKATPWTCRPSSPEPYKVGE